MGYPTQQQKVDYLFKKIGFTKTKTGVAEDQTSGFSGDTKKAPPNEAIASPLIVPGSSVWSDSSFITATPPTSNTAYVGVYTTATAYRMTVDTTVANERTFIARQTWGNPSSAIEGDWIDTQFGADYLIKVYKNDPSVGVAGVDYFNLSAAGTTGKDDVWFFDYSSGVLNFNGEDLDGQLSGITTSNIYIVGYRYIGRKGIQPPAGIGTFHDLVVSNNLSVGGISTFGGLIDANGIIEGIAGQNKIPSLYANYSDLPNAGTYHGMFAHVHGTQKGYFAHAGGWYELVNKETNGRVGTGTETYHINNLNVTGITTLGNIGISTGRITGPSITYIDPATVGDDTGTLVVKGNLQVEGTQTTVNSSTMTVTDKNIELAKGAANDAAADGGGITIDSGGGDKTWQWLDATDSWTSSEHIRIPNDKVFGFASDTNTYIGRPAADTIAFTHGGGEKVRIDSSGRVLIGTTTEGFAEADDLTINSADHGGITIRTPTNKEGNIAFSDTTSGTGEYSGLIRYRHSQNDLGLWTNSNLRLLIDSSGRVLIGTTTEGRVTADNLTIASNGHTGMTIRSGTSHGGNISFSDGTSGDDENRGLVSYDHASNFMRFYTNATEKLRIDTDGNTNIVGVVTASHFDYITSKNIRIGENAGDSFSGTDANENILIGYNAGTAIDVCDKNVAIGVSALESVTGNRHGCVAIGYEAAKSYGNDGLTTGPIAIGYQALKAGGKGVQVAIGYRALTNCNNTGLWNVAVGSDSLRNVTSGKMNVAYGTQALYTITSAEKNTALGHYAGNDLNSGNNNIIIGYHADASGTNVSNEITLGNGDITKFRIPGIGVTLTDGIVTIPTPVIDISGDVTVGGNFKVVGVSTFSDDVTFVGDNYDLQWDKSDNALEFGDSTFAVFGGQGDLKIRHNTTVTPNVSQITNRSDSELEIIADQFKIRSSTGSKSYLTATVGSATTLFYNGNEKLTTTNTGINVTGLTETDTLNTGNATFTGTISAGSTTGTNGYYLKTTGIGVTWAAFPSSRTTSTQTATAGQTTFNFSYNVGYVDVFLNGVKLPESEFVASNGSTIVLDDAAFVNDTLEFVSYNTVPNSSAGAQNLTGLADVTITGTPVIGETLQHNGSVFVNDYTVSTTTTSTSQTAISSLPVATYRSVEYTIQVTEGTKYHVTKVLAIHDGTNVSFNEYGTLTTSTSLSTFALDINSGNMRLLATPASTNSTVFKVKFTGIKV